MAIEVKDIISYLGFKPEDIKELDDLKPAFESEFVRVANINEDYEPVKKIIGKTFGSIETNITQLAKSKDINFDDVSDWKESKLKDKLKIFATKLEEKSSSTIEELTKKASLNSDEKVKELETKLEKSKSKINDLDGLLKSTSNEFTAYKETAAKQIKGVKLDTLKTDALSKIKFKPDISEFEKEGYMSVIQKKYKFDLDENDKFVVMDSSGKLIPNTKVSGTFKTINEVLEEEAIAGKLFQMNVDAGKPKPNVNKTIVDTTTPTSGQRQVAQRMKIG